MNILPTNPFNHSPRRTPKLRCLWKLWTLLFVLVAAPLLLLTGCGKTTQVESDTVWTCSMHPEIRRNKPGLCPKCDMELIPASKDENEGQPRQHQLNRAAMALAEIETTPVTRRYVNNTIRMVGKVAYDETRLSDITAWVPGRLDRLYVDYTGVTVKKGDHMVYMYSPDLVVAQKELILAMQNYQRYGKGDMTSDWYANVRSVEERLRLAGLIQTQIDEIKRSQKPLEHITIYAPAGGVVVEKKANQGSYVQTGTRIYTIADLSQVWIHLDAYESDVPWLRYGQQVEFETESYPGEIFKGRIAFIDKFIDEKTRTAKVRVNVANKQMLLKPGMFVRARVQSALAAGGQVIDTALAGKWLSPMHPEIVKDGPGKCDICGMALVPAEELGFVAGKVGAKPLVIPASAPLITGRRAVVYVKVPPSKEPLPEGEPPPKTKFRGREILLGHRVDDYYIIHHGLEEGEQVVTKGAFKLDAELQISARPSMMNPQGGVAATGHEHHGGKPSAVSVVSHEHGKKEELDVPAEFRVQLRPIFQAYLAISDALASDDLAAARQQLKSLLDQAPQVSARQLDADGRGRWKTVQDRIVFAAFETSRAPDREATRDKFLELSDAVLEMTHTFGHALDKPVYHFHCTMVQNNRGGGWLQLFEEARNPYFGAKMLDCGDRKATFYSAGPLQVPPEFRRQLTPLVEAYLKVHQAMSQSPTKVKDQPQRLDQGAAEMRSALRTIDAGNLDSRASQAWRIIQTRLSEALASDFTGQKVELQRRRFESLSGVMLGVVNEFGHDYPSLLRKAHCPMAFNDSGAFWLQTGDKIANPYFSGKMPTCGDFKRDFVRAAAVKKNDAPRESQP